MKYSNWVIGRERWTGSKIIAAKPISLIVLLGVLMLSVMPTSAGAQAPTTTIASLNYPAQTVLQNEVAQATVTFTVNYSGLTSGDGLIFGVYLNSAGNYSNLMGSGTSAPDQCVLMTSSTLAGIAICGLVPPSTSGTESASFAITLTAPPQQYSLVAAAFVSDPVHNISIIRSSLSLQGFTISLVAQTASTGQPTSETSEATTTTTASMADLLLGLSILVLPIVAIIGLIVFVVRRRKRASKGVYAELGTVSRPSPTRVPAVEGNKFCIACVASLPTTASFCGECGAEQN